MTRIEAEQKYHDLGLVTRYIQEKPRECYEPHRHGGVYLYTLSGSVKLKLDDDAWQTLGAGKEAHILDNQLHEALVGDEGWEYIFAATPEETKRQGL